MAALLLAQIARGGYTPPMDLLISDHEVSAIRDDLTSQHWDDAVSHIETALSPSPGLVKIDDRIIPLTTAVSEMLPDAAAVVALSAAYEKAAGPAASAALSDAIKNADVAAIARVATRWPWTSAAARVPTEMARGLAAAGDLDGVQSLLRIAPQATAALKPLAAIVSDSAGEPVLNSVAWYNLIRPIDFPRVQPVGSKDAVFIASPTAAAAVSPIGKLLWSTGTPPPPTALPKEAEHMPRAVQLMLFSEHSLTSPAVWCDPGGVARVVVVRQSIGDASILTALRAADGSSLWSTAENDSIKSLLMLGSPIVRGRYVYSLALDNQPPALPHMSVLAVDLPSGRLLWQTQIGDAIPTAAGMFVPSLITSSPVELAADDGSLYASLEGGSVISVERFGGSVNWIAAYAAVTANRQEMARQLNSNHKPVLHRWRDHVAITAGVAAVAPTDSPKVVAYDAVTGKRAWILDDGDGAELAGVAGGNFILAGSKLLALTPSGATVWQIDYASAPAGPAIIDGDLIFTPTQSGAVVYAAATGKVLTTPPKDLLTTGIFGRHVMTKKALDKLGLLALFAAPPDVGRPPSEMPKPIKPPAKKR